MTLNPKSAINISSLPKVHCFGCTACVSICPLDCIHIITDREGFNYPSVDEEVCNACRKCVRVCPGFNDLNREKYNPEPKFFGGFHQGDQIRVNSSSGGFFSACAEEILSQGGTVYGAVYDFEQMVVVHARTSSRENLNAMRKSKYVQSNTRGVFEQVKEDLQANLPVLFTGTPCQVEGLNLYLGSRHRNLFTIDLVCHGVPSPGLFTSHFLKRQDQLGSSITKIDFRTKDKGWGGALNFFLKVESIDREVLTFAPLDAYYAMFLANLSLRPVCYQCKFASTQRVGDITLGDFWGVQKEHPELFDSKGTSLILVNTEKGQRMLMDIQGDVLLQALDAPNPLPPNLVKPTPKPGLRKSFLSSIHFENWGNQRTWKHILALGVLVKIKIFQGIKALLGLN